MDLLDFSSSVTTPDYIAYATMHNAENISVMPRNLCIRTSEEGIPFFYLEAVRGITPFSKPSPYGIIQLQLAPSDITATMIAEIREKWPSATLRTPDFGSGYLGLQLIANDDETVLDELETPVKLTNLPLSRLRFVRRISMDYLQLIQDALQKGLLLFKAFGICSVKGYSARVPITLEFDPRTLGESLLKEFENDADRIPISVISDFFKRPLEDLPFAIKEKEAGSEELQCCLTDWYCHRFCTVSPPVATDDAVFFELNEDALSTGNFIWDLSEALVVERYIHFTFDALKEALDLVRERGMDALFTTTIVGPLQTGFLRVEIFHPFDQIPLGILQMGVKLNALPNPPERNRTINETVVFENGQDKKNAILRFSAKEKQEYEVTPFAIYGDSSGTKEILGRTKKAVGQELIVSHQDFPFSFRSLSGSQNLLSEASLTLHVKNDDAEEPMFDAVVLDNENPVTLFAFAKEASEKISCEVSAESLESEETVTTSFPLLFDQKIDLTSFREYGSHKVTVRLNVSERQVVAIDLLPEHLEPNPLNITTVAFSENKKETVWHWFAPNMFRSGFRYRFHGEGIWSQVHSPFTKTLELNLQNQLT